MYVYVCTQVNWTSKEHNFGCFVALRRCGDCNLECSERVSEQTSTKVLFGVSNNVHKWVFMYWYWVIVVVVIFACHCLWLCCRWLSFAERPKQSQQFDYYSVSVASRHTHTHPRALCCWCLPPVENFSSKLLSVLLCSNRPSSILPFPYIFPAQQLLLLSYVYVCVYGWGWVCCAVKWNENWKPQNWLVN